MKIEVRKVMEPMEKRFYVADDGTVFEDEDRCRHYESAAGMTGEDETRIAASLGMLMKGLDKINEALQILDGVRDNMLLLESSCVKDMPTGICIVFETAVNRVQSLLCDAALAVEKDIMRSRSGTQISNDKELQ